MKKLIVLIMITATFQQVFSQGVGINSTEADPDSSAMLDVNSTTKGMLIPRMTTTQRNAISSPATGLFVYDTDLDQFYFYDGSAWTAIATGIGSQWTTTGSDIYYSTGYVGIGVTSPSYGLELPNTGSNAGKGRAKQWTTYSSKRWKKDVRTMDSCILKVMQLRGVEYNWKAENGGGHDVGFIAEEVGEVFPEIVDWEDISVEDAQSRYIIDGDSTTGPNPNYGVEPGKYAAALSYSSLIPVLVGAIQEQQSLTESQVETITSLTDLVNALKARLEALEAK